MKVAIAGCVHGELDRIYQTIAQTEAQHLYKVDLLLVCGDFQALRNYADLECMAVPDKYKAMGTFHKYYTGAMHAPILTLVIGGNHEASNYLWELYHGGWLAPNIYFLGHSGCVNVNGVRIAGSSGIWNKPHFNWGHFESLPYDKSSMRSIYHTRKYDVFKLSLLSSPSIVMSHDWPQGIENNGNLAQLLKSKPFFKSDIQSGQLGNPPMMDLLKSLKPNYWFSAHLHVRYQAVYDHSQVNGVKPTHGEQKAAVQPVLNPDEILIDDDDDAPVQTTAEEPIVPQGVDEKPEEATAITIPNQTTKFLALDKVLGSRRFLDIIDVSSIEPNPSTPKFCFDPEWLAITKAMHPYLSLNQQMIPLPTLEAAREMVAAELKWVQDNALDKESKSGDLLEVLQVQQFAETAPGPIGQGKHAQRNQRLAWYTNPQTEALCSKLGIENKINPVPAGYQPPAPVPSSDSGPASVSI